MYTINYLTDETTVSRFTKNRAWLDTYVPEITKRLKEMGFNIVFDSETGFDLVHIHMPLRRAYQLIRESNGDCRYPVVFHGHATEDSFTVGSTTKYLVRKWFRKLADRSDLIICPSKYAEEYYRSLLPGHDVVQLNNGINLDEYSYSDEARIDFRNQFGIDKDEMVVSCVGGISNRKGIDDFINVAKQHPGTRFMWVGGEYTQHPSIDMFYKVFARQGEVDIKNLPDNLLMTGYVSDMRGALSAGDIFFFPSRQETQGLALVEAAANGRAIVARNLPVFTEWLKPGHDCLMGNNVEEFEACISRLADDTSLRNRLGTEAQKSAREHHDIDKTAKRLGMTYIELLG